MLTQLTISKYLTWFLIAFLGVALVYGLLLRPWLMRWGATDQEIAMVYAGDPDIPPGSIVSTRGITIQAPPEVIWPWLSQIGQERAGFYSYEWLENLFGADMPMGDKILPPERRLQIGSRVSYLRGGPPGTYDFVTVLEPNRVLAVRGWSFTLLPVDAHTTRLVVRYPSDMHKTPGGAVFYSIFEPAHFIMEAGMMMGLKQRAEASHALQPLAATVLDQ